MIGCANGKTVNAFDGTCLSKVYMYTKNANGDRVVIRAGPLPIGPTCGAQRGFCAPGGNPPAVSPTINTAAIPWQITVGGWQCNLQTGFASNNWQLACLTAK